MTQQRIVLKVEMSGSPKLRTKALKIASGASGVRGVSIQGQNDQLVVIGAEVDLAELIRDLRKKVGSTNIVTVQAAPPQPQMQTQTQTQQGYNINEMPQVRRCVCEIPNSGFCGFCRATNNQNQQFMNNSSYQYHPLYYPPCPDDYGSCIIM